MQIHRRHILSKPDRSDVDINYTLAQVDILTNRGY
jgi:hypothetical protein